MNNVLVDNVGIMTVSFKRVKVDLSEEHTWRSLKTFVGSIIWISHILYLFALNSTEDYFFFLSLFCISSSEHRESIKFQSGEMWQRTKNWKIENLILHEKKFVSRLLNITYVAAQVQVCIVGWSDGGRRSEKNAKSRPCSLFAFMMFKNTRQRHSALQAMTWERTRI